VYTLPNPMKKVDSVAFYPISCSGAFMAQFIVIPLSETLINLNLYFDSWFRWEIGGKDLRSVRLFKNMDGCTSAMKNVEQVYIENEYLAGHDQISFGEPLDVIFSVFPTETGKLKTEVDLTYVSLKDKRQRNVKGWFYYEFDIDETCGKESVLNILNDKFRIGIGLQPSSVNSENIEKPKIKLDKFKILPH